MSDEKKTDVPAPTVKSGAGKGDKPRNISRQFWNNWDEIDWGRPKKKDKKSD